jgi:signal transduction histidine kinase
VVALGLIGVQILRVTGRSEAVRDATRLSAFAGDGIVSPHLTPALLHGDRAAIKKLDKLVRAQVLKDPVVRVKIWDSRSRIVFSDVNGLIGARYPLRRDEHVALRTGSTDADISDLAHPENRFERRYGKLLEVYKGIKGPQGEPLLFEAYLRYSSVSASGRRLWLRFAPALIGGLLLLELIQIPLAYLLARRLRERERERGALLQRALDASDLERRRLAVELHEGPVQSLAGVAFSLAGAADGLPASSNGMGDAVRDAARQTRETMRELRGMLAGLYPASVRRSGLGPALSDLLAPVRAAGVETDLRIEGDAAPPPDIEELLYRAAREAVQNALKHAKARRIEVVVSSDSDRLRLTVRDDGIGFPVAAEFARPQDGHIGLPLIADLAAQAGGSVDIQSGPTVGTSVTVEVPRP